MLAGHVGIQALVDRDERASLLIFFYKRDSVMNDLTAYACPPLHRLKAFSKVNKQFIEKDLTDHEILVFRNLLDHNTPYVGEVDREQKTTNALTMFRRRGWIETWDPDLTPSGSPPNLAENYLRNQNE